MRMSFLDAFQGYHQIALAIEDQEKTSFISPKANHHYTIMPFGLKNADTIYQRMMFKEKINRTVEVYINDIVVKNKEEQEQLRLNADKCIFGVGLANSWGT